MRFKYAILNHPLLKAGAEAVIAEDLVFDRKDKEGYYCEGGGCVLYEVLRRANQLGGAVPVGMYAPSPNYVAKVIGVEMVVGGDDATYARWATAVDDIRELTNVNDAGFLNTTAQVRAYLVDDSDPVICCPGCHREIDSVRYFRNVRLEVSGGIDVRYGHDDTLEVRYTEGDDEGMSDTDDPEYEVRCPECDHDLTEMLSEACGQQEAWTALEEAACATGTPNS